MFLTVLKSTFTARGLNHRAGTLDNRKNGIDQGISTVQTILEGIEALDNFLGQLRGLPVRPDRKH